jgi:Icc-related predicted phosphoesterase
MFKRTKRAYRIYFATDIHGSDRCFRKFLAAARVYEADVLILGGDIVGKAIVPITRVAGDHYVATFQEQRETCTADGLPALEGRINFNGLYPWIAEENEVERLRDDPEFAEAVFEDIMVNQVKDWCELAAERLGDRTPCVITPGNDDPFAIDPVLREHLSVECPEGEVVPLGPVWLASLGNTNRTPWATDREYDEPDLAAQIDRMLAPVADGRPLVLNFHCPPAESGLDVALALDDELRPVLKGGALVEIPAGSVAVRDAIVNYRPVAGLHGHIHESPGMTRIGSTVCLNPGSEYSSGILKGVLLDLNADGEYHDHLLTTG